MYEHSHLKNVFWVDVKSIAAYEALSDVTSFDTTYITNKYNMPVAPFGGENHDEQIVLFGFCLTSKVEDTKSYIWLFKSLLECMACKASQVIITYQWMKEP